MKHPIGIRVIISEGSGIDSGKCGTIVSPSTVITDKRGIPYNVAGAYTRIDWKRESAMLLDDGTLITMFDNRIERLENEETEL